MAESKNKRKFKGVVVSSSMNKTIVVKVERMTVHPKYGKNYRVSKGYKVHDEKNECSKGDRVFFEECRPLSKDKRWRLVEKIS